MKYSQDFENKKVDGWSTTQSDARLLTEPDNNHYIAPSEYDKRLFNLHRNFKEPFAANTLTTMSFKIKVPTNEKVIYLACGFIQAGQSFEFDNMPESDGKWHEYEAKWTTPADANLSRIDIFVVLEEKTGKTAIETGVDNIKITQ